MMDDSVHDTLESEREAIRRFCLRYTRDVHVADELAQLTMIHAWKHEHELRDGAARRKWLFAIAHNVCRSWGRSRQRELSSRANSWDGMDDAREEQHTGDFDLEVELERTELVTLLDRALGLLLPEARDILIRRYIEESPQAEVAAQLGISEGAVEARLHRGKLALRRVLTTNLCADALVYGLITPQQSGWETTRVWCPSCGARPLDGLLNPVKGTLDMRCTACSERNFIHAYFPSELQDVKTYKPALSRVLMFIHDTFRVRQSGQGLSCVGCGQHVPLRFSKDLGIYLRCDACGWLDHETWHSLTWSLPEIREFWKAHPRMRFLPEREIEVGGVPAVVTGFQSVTNADRLDVVSVRDTVQIIAIHGAAGDRT